jgi:LmbE family N-acetylglucosaminyl deacetylase
MGGTVAKLSESNAVITSIVVTNGGRASNPFAWTERRMAEVRREEALRAAGILGVKDVVFLDEPDAADEINASAVKHRLMEMIDRLRPVEVYTLHQELDRHPAHRLVSKLLTDSVTETGFAPSGGIWAYEVWGLFTRWDRLEYIDGHVAKKLLAIGEHRSQVATIPYGEGVLGLNRWRAVFADPKASAPSGAYAEVFQRVSGPPR